KLEESSESSISDEEDDSSRSDSSSESSSLSKEDSENVENKSGNTGKDSLVVDLSVSESKPLTSYGSGEDEEGVSGEEYVYTEADIPTSIQRSDTQREQPAEDSSQEAGSVSPSGDVGVEEGNKEDGSG
uniref:Uncharacterized protein n=1 Tax=Ciona savignyi TaxID=51511 RepID=H2Y4V3_CIOSA